MGHSQVRRRFHSLSSEATEALGESLGRAMVAGAVLALDGELGAGKTALVRGLARGLEVQESITSPTFTLMIEHEGRLPFFHFDAWMAGRESRFLEGGGADYLGSQGVCAVEWAARVKHYLPPVYLAVCLGHRTPEQRLIECELVGQAQDSPALFQALEQALLDLRAGVELIELSWTAGEPSQVLTVEP